MLCGRYMLNKRSDAKLQIAEFACACQPSVGPNLWRKVCKTLCTVPSYKMHKVKVCTKQVYIRYSSRQLFRTLKLCTPSSASVTRSCGNLIIQKGHKGTVSAFLLCPKLGTCGFAALLGLHFRL